MGPEPLDRWWQSDATQVTSWRVRLNSSAWKKYRETSLRSTGNKYLVKTGQLVKVRSRSIFVCHELLEPVIKVSRKLQILHVFLASCNNQTWSSSIVIPVVHLSQQEAQPVFPVVQVSWLGRKRLRVPAMEIGPENLFVYVIGETLFL